MSDPRVMLLPVFSGFILAVAGCQSGDASKSSATVEAQKPVEQKVTEAELRGYCPRVTLRDGTSAFANYAKGGNGDPTKMIYQASLNDVTRSCSTVGGTLTMTVAVAGRVVPGPAFSPGNATLPIRVAVTHGSELLYSQLHRYQVTTADSSAATQFVFSDTNVSFALPADRAVQVFAGFDEGPAKK